MKKIVALNTVSQLIGKAVSAVATFIVTFLVARQLGASGYGDFVKITTYVAFFYLLADFGINAVFLQHDDKENWPALVTLRLVGGVALIATSLIVLALLPGNQSQGYTTAVRLGIILFSPTILFQGFITTANAIFQKRLRYDLAAWAIFFGSVATILLAWKPTSVFMFVGAVATGAFVSAIFSFAFASRLVGHIRFSPSLGQIKRLLIPSIPLGITLLFNLVYFRADSVIITLTRSTSEVGVYGLAYKVFEVVLVFPTFFMNAVYPIMLNQQHVKLKKIFINSFLFLLLTSVVSLSVIWFAAPLLSFIKSDFTQSVGALRVLSLGLPFFFVTSTTMWALIALKKQRTLAVIYGVSMIVNVAGNILLVPSHGFMAAAWLTVASEGLVLALSGLVLLQSFSRTKK
jgi:O-antigen/teichoic acid export membrane protein